MPIHSVRFSTPTAALSEAGLYKMILRSDKEVAEKFRTWLTRDVLPAIRKDGAYVMGEEKVATGEMSEDEFVLKAMGILQGKVERLRVERDEAVRKAQVEAARDLWGCLPDRPCGNVVSPARVSLGPAGRVRHREVPAGHSPGQIAIPRTNAARGLRLLWVGGGLRCGPLNRGQRVLYAGELAQRFRVVVLKHEDCAALTLDRPAAVVAIVW